jgi:glycosyltransferase involved in cell wall biosynthesis
VTRRILIFGVLRLQEIVAKGNATQLRSYEHGFDEVHVAYLLGDAPAVLHEGRTYLWSLGGRSRVRDAILAPWRLWRFFQRHGPFDVIQTPDIFFMWWTTLFLRVLARRRIVVVPVSMPDQLYKDGSRTPTGLPFAIERQMVNLSFACAGVVLTGLSNGGFVEWLRTDRRTRHKVLVVENLPDAVINPRIISESGTCIPRTPGQHGPVQLICVSRLHSEKLLEDLIFLMALLRKRGFGPELIRLRLIGDGPDKEYLLSAAQAAGCADAIEFVGAVPNGEVVTHLRSADIFVSPLTGTSLREAAFCALPIVAYDRDWLRGCIVHEDHALLTPSRDIAALADAIERLMRDHDLCRRVGENARCLAYRLWSEDGVAEACAAISARANA